MFDTDKDLFKCVLKVNIQNKEGKGVQIFATKTITFKDEDDRMTQFFVWMNELWTKLENSIGFLGIKYINNCTKFQYRCDSIIIGILGQDTTTKNQQHQNNNFLDC